MAALAGFHEARLRGRGRLAAHHADGSRRIDLSTAAGHSAGTCPAAPQTHFPGSAFRTRGTPVAVRDGYSRPMTTAALAGSALPAETLESLEQIVFGAVGLTSFALASAGVTDLTLPQWRALVVIGRQDGIRVGEVAARLGMSLPSASRLIRRLEWRGLVTTERDETDRRATRVLLTHSGRQIRSAVIECRRALLRDAVSAHVPHVPRHLASCLALLAKALARYA